MDPWHFLNLRPLPQGQGSFRPGLLLTFAPFSPEDYRKEVSWQGHGQPGGPERTISHPAFDVRSSLSEYTLDFQHGGSLLKNALRWHFGSALRPWGIYAFLCKNK
jgi:hypothetical protein